MIKIKDTVSRRAYIIAIAALLGFAVFSLREFASEGPASLIITVISIAATMSLIIALHRYGRITREAFSIPLVLYLAHSFLSFLTGNYADFFVLCLGICCLGALYFDRRSLLTLIIVSNIFTAAQILFRVPMTVPDLGGVTEMTMAEIMLNWTISISGSLFVLMVTAFAEDKNNDAQNAQDSFVGLLTSTPDPIVLLDSQNRVTYISNSFMKMIHLERSILAKGRPVFDILKDRNLWNLFYEILTGGESFQITREVILDGKQYFFEIVVFELVNDTKGHLVNIVDITPVMKAKFEAEAASHSKSAFLATMSHEIRTPLNAIIGLSEIELQKQLSADTRADLEKIHNSGANLLGIINDILDISKIEAGSFELVPVDYDLPSLVNDTVQLNIVRIGSKNIIFRLKIDPAIPMRLFGDELRVKQVLNNLLSNAIKYTKEGTITFSIAWERKENDALVTYTVRDTGRGIKAEDVPRLFSEYRQLDATANRHIEGTGLGLSITKNLVSLMSGTISVESEYGVGTAFTVCLPQRITDETPIGEITMKNLESFRFKEIHRSQGLKLVRNYMPYGKVLVVDDVETNLDVARGLMLPYGLSIDTASSGAEAIAKIRTASGKDAEARYDVILMDHMMPGMDGMEAVRIIRNELPGDYCKNVPIVALTANALAGNEEMFLANGFNAFISKPVDVIQLDAALNAWVRNKQSLEILRQAEPELARTEETNHNNPGILDDAQIEGIDLAKGRERYNSETAYLEILRSWYVHTPTLLETLSKLSPGNLPEYTVTVHGLKGSSFGIFANEIGGKAEELEHYARAGDYEYIRAKNADFIKMTEKTLRDVGELLKKSGEARGVKQKISSPDPAALAGLLDAAKRYKSTIMEEVMAKIESYDYEAGGELVTWLREQMDNLEYDAIRERLEMPNPINTA